MSDAPGGGGYLPWRWTTSGRFTPAAATWMTTSSSAGTGIGRVVTLSTSGGPGCAISTALIVKAVLLKRQLSVLRCAIVSAASR
jgi:hypothetical protein